MLRACIASLSLLSCAAGARLTVSGQLASSHQREACMTTPPDFGGLEIEEGVQEDLGAPPQHRAAGHEDSAVSTDNEAHAPGNVCPRCGTVITPGQDVRRRADGN